MLNFGVSYIGVLVSAILAMVIGMIWYGPLFGKKWMSLLGWTDKVLNEMKKVQMNAMFLGFIKTLITIFVLAVILKTLGIASILDSVSVALLVWIGFVGASDLSPTLWEGKNPKLFLINGGYDLIVLVISAIVLAFI